MTSKIQKSHGQETEHLDIIYEQASYPVCISKHSSLSLSAALVQLLFLTLTKLIQNGKIEAADAALYLGCRLEEARELLRTLCQLCDAEGLHRLKLLVLDNANSTSLLTYTNLPCILPALSELDVYTLVQALHKSTCSYKDLTLLAALSAGAQVKSTVTTAAEQSSEEGTYAITHQLQHTLDTCCTALLKQQLAHIQYAQASQLRHLLILKLYYQQANWYIQAFDINKKAHRNFSLKRIHTITLQQLKPHQRAQLNKLIKRITTELPDTTERIYMQVYNWEMFSTYEWPGLIIHARTSESTNVSLPYYQNSWLISRICALSPYLHVSDSTLRKCVQSYAKLRLELAQRRWSKLSNAQQ